MGLNFSSKFIVLISFIVTSLCAFEIPDARAQEILPAPPINNSPVIDKPPILNWKTDRAKRLPDLTEQTANRIYDLHAMIKQCDLVLSTAGNYHMALRDLWFNEFLPNNRDLNLKNWFYTTSPPISPEQIQNRYLGMGNFRSRCTPQVAVGPQSLTNTLQALALTEGLPTKIIKNYGNVLLVKKGNPKSIRTIWDLARNDVRVVTSNPQTEIGSFSNYRDSIYNIALHNSAGAPAGMDAQQLFDAIFNNVKVRGKWLAGGRIHHREVPWSIALGHADVGPIFYHLALHAINRFPNKFEIVFLHTNDDINQPLEGNRVAVMQAVRIAGNWNAKQLQARERLMKAMSPSVVPTPFDTILATHGLRRP